MTDSKSNLSIFCTEQNLVRSTYFSDTYRAVFEMDGVTKTWDITHIEFPFAPDKERALQARFGISKSELFGFYKQFAACVQNGMRVASYISALPDEEQDDGSGRKKKPLAVKQASALFTYRGFHRKEGTQGSDLWLVSEPMDKFVGSEYFSGTAISLRNLLSFAARTVQSINGMAAFGLHIGALDLDTILLQSIDGKKFFCFGSFLFAGFDKASAPAELKHPWPDLKGLKILPGSTDPSIQQGDSPSLVSDMHSLVALLWTMLSGKCYRDKPDYDTPPKYAPQELLDVLTQARVSDDPVTLKVLYKTLNRIVKDIGLKRLPDVVIHLEPPKAIELLPEPPEATEPSPEPPKEQPKPVPESTPMDTVQPEEKLAAAPSPSPEPAPASQAGLAQDAAAQPEQAISTPKQEPPQPETPPVTETVPKGSEGQTPPQKAEVVAELIAVPIKKDINSTVPGGQVRDAKPVPPQKAKPSAPGKAAGSKVKGSAPANKAPQQRAPQQQAPQQRAPQQQAPQQQAPQQQIPQQQGQTVPMGTGMVPPGMTTMPGQNGQMGYQQPLPPYVMPPIFVLPSGYPGYGPPMPGYTVPGQMPQGQAAPAGQGQNINTSPPKQPSKGSPFKTGKQGQTKGTQPHPKQSNTRNVVPKSPVIPPHARPNVSAKPQAPKNAEYTAKTQDAAGKTAAKTASAAEGESGKKVVRRTVTTVKKKKRKNRVAVLLTVLFLLAALSFLGAAGLQYMGYDVPWNIPYVDQMRGSTFTVTPTEIVLATGEETVLTSSEGCTLSSSDHNVAVVNDTGHVKAIGPGSCVITARASSSSATVRIQVTVVE